MDVQVSMPPPPPPPPPPGFFPETTTSQLASPPPPQPVTTTTTNVATTSTQDRIWLHPWTVTEMRENASQWSLAGDAGVLLYMEQFSDKLIQRADAIQQHLNQTVNAVKSTHTRVLNCLNEFTSLANTQFIENRVYDEDETADNTSKKDEQSAEKTNATEAQEKVLQRYVEAIQCGLAILDTHFERVETKLDNNQNGDSSYVDDEEDGGVSLEPILEPKDPYLFRPLPHLIGTTEFMQDDYVGLGDLLTLRDEDGYEVIQTEKFESDPALSSESEDDEPEDKKEEDFQAQMSPAPIVPAGASRPDFTKPQPTIQLTDSETDDEDPFGINKNITKIDDISSKPATTDYDLFGEETKPPQPPPPKTNNFALDKDSDNEDNDDLFNNSNQKPQPIIKNPDAKFDDTSPSSSEEPDEPEEQKPKGVSMFGGPQTGMAAELAARVLRQRKRLGDPDSTSDNDKNDDEDDFVRKPPKNSNKTTSKPKSEPSSSTISNLTSQPLTTPAKIPKPSIFGENDDDDDPFGGSLKPATIIPSSTTKVDTKIQPKKEKDLFDVSDEDDPFAVKKPAPASTIKTETIQKPQPTVIVKPKQPIYSDHSEDDEIFGKKPTQTKPTTISSTPPVTQNNKSLDDDDDELFITPKPSIPKPQPSASTTTTTITTKLSDDEDPLFSKPSVPQVVPSPAPAPAPVVISSVKKPVPPANEDSDEDMFNIPKKPLQTLPTATSKIVPSTKHDDDNEDDELFNKTTTKTPVLPKAPPKVIPTAISDEENDLFPPKPNEVKSPPPPVTSSPLSSAPSRTNDTYVDPLGIQKPVEPIKTPSTPIKDKLSDDDSDEGLTAKSQINKAALKDGEKASVKNLAGLLKLPQGAFKPGLRPKTRSITEEPPSPSIDDNQPIQNIEPPPAAITKKSLKLDLDSGDDDDDLFKTNKKKETPISPIVEKKDKTNIENENENENGSGKINVKALSSRIKLPLMSPMSGSPSKRTSNEDNESNNTTQITSNEQSTIDKTMLDISKDRTKVIAKNRTPRSRPTRSARAAAASTDENDDLFGSSNSTTTATSSPPVVVPIIPPPSVAVPVIPPPSIAVPVTGLPDKSAAIAAKQTNSKEKKKFSLFNSDDSDIDELLFGFSKKTKSSVVTKPTTTPSTTTTKATTKSSILSLDDDNDDFLSKRPTKKITKPVDIDDNDDFVSKRPIKKTTKPVDNDDIFADVKAKGPQTNKAKKDWSIMDKSTADATDDIFNETSKKSSSTTSKPKSTKNFDDLFDDPLNISSKR